MCNSDVPGKKQRRHRFTFPLEGSVSVTTKGLFLSRGTSGKANLYHPFAFLSRQPAWDIHQRRGSEEEKACGVSCEAHSGSVSTWRAGPGWSASRPPDSLGAVLINCHNFLVFNSRELRGNFIKHPECINWIIKQVLDIIKWWVGRHLSLFPWLNPQVLGMCFFCVVMCVLCCLNCEGKRIQCAKWSLWAPCPGRRVWGLWGWGGPRNFTLSVSFSFEPRKPSGFVLFWAVPEVAYFSESV